MNVYVIRDNFLDESVYSSVLEKLKSIKGQIEFIQGAGDALIVEFENKEAKSDDDILNKLYNFRQSVNAIEEDDILVLVSEIKHTDNWFSFGANVFDRPEKNIYINTSLWSESLGLEQTSAIVHEIASNIMQMLMFENKEETWNHIHIDKTLGCFNDYCENIGDVKTKMRTADVCVDCQEHIESKKIDLHIIKEFIELLELARKDLLFVERFNRGLQNYTIKIDSNGKFFAVKDNFSEQEIKLRPREKALYHFFLERNNNNNNAILTNDLADHKDRLLQIYTLYVRVEDHNNNRHVETIGNLVNVEENSFSETNSGINKALKKIFGEYNIEDYRIKQQEGGGFRINLDVNRIIIENETRRVTNQFGH
jgi:hypothetical protein